MLYDLCSNLSNEKYCFVCTSTLRILLLCYYIVDLFPHLLPTGYMESQRCIAVEGDAGGDSAKMKINHYVSNTWLKYFNTLSWAEALQV